MGVNFRCWNGSTCSRGCIEPCRPPVDPRRVLSAPQIDWSATNPAEIDWRKILKVYISAILQAESITFMREIPGDALTETEHAALLALDAEVKRETPYS